VPLVEDVAPLNRFQLHAYIGAADTINVDWAAVTVPRAGVLARIGSVQIGAQADNVQFTIYKNGTSTAVVATAIAAGSAGDGDIWLASDGEKLDLEFAAGDVCELRVTNASATGGERRFWMEFEGGGDASEVMQAAYSADVGAGSESAHTGFLGAGHVAGIAGVAYTAADGIPLLTLYRNGATTGVTVQVGAADLDTAKDGVFYEFGPGEIEKLHFEKDEVLTLLSDGNGTAGEIWWTVVFKRGPERPNNEQNSLAYFAGVGDASAIAYAIALRRSRVVAVGGAFSEAQTGALSTVTVEKNGTDVLQGSTPAAVTFEAPLASAGDPLPPTEFQLDGEEISASSLDMEAGDVIGLDSDVAGTNGELYCQIALREI